MVRLGSELTTRATMLRLSWTQTATTSKLFFTEMPRGVLLPSKFHFELSLASMSLGRSPAGLGGIALPGLPLLLDALLNVTDGLILVRGNMLILLGVILTSLLDLSRVGC